MAVNGFLPPFLGPLPLYSVHFFGGLALFLAWALLAPHGVRRPALFGLVGAVLGGHGITQWTLGTNLGLYLGALGAAMLLLPLVRQGLDWRRLADEALPPLALAFALMKLGCLAGGCCLGAPHSGSLYAVYHSHWPVVPKVLVENPHWEGLRLFPAPLYTSVLALAIGLGGLWFAPRLRGRPGVLAGLSIAGYCLGRAIIDGGSGALALESNLSIGLGFVILTGGVALHDGLARSHRGV